jgi:phage tail sheath protein FI
MPVAPTYPGVYVEELPSGVRTITGVATSITAFIGFAPKGLTNEPVRIQNFGSYERLFGGLNRASTMSYAVQQFFLNGGSDAIIVRLSNQGDDQADSATSAEYMLPREEPQELVLTAASEGQWGNNLQISVDYDTATPDKTFNLKVDVVENGQKLSGEVIRNISMDPLDSRFIAEVLATQSSLVRINQMPDGLTRPDQTKDNANQSQPITAPSTKGSDGKAPTDDSLYIGDKNKKTGLYALEKADLFNLLCMPPATRDGDISNSTWTAAAKYCLERRAFLLIDPPTAWSSQANAVAGADAIRNAAGSAKSNAAVFFPRVKLADPLKENRMDTFAPCGIMAGVFSRTDADRGVWKAPAGTEASLNGVQGLAVSLTNGENGLLNPLGVNCLRNFPVYGNVAWGARTLDGDDRLASEWKYVPVRRLALFLEESLYRGTQWVVFEPNDEPLWAQIRLNIGSFMNNLFKQGAFQGSSPKEAYFVKCDKETTTQNDINLGIVNIIVGYAPLKPAEFVILKFQQIAGQLET